MRKNPGADLKVTKLLELVKQYDEAREKQVGKQNRKIEACEAKLESFMKNNPPSPSPSLNPSSPSFNPRTKTPPTSSVFQGKALHYVSPPFALSAPTPAAIQLPSGALTEQMAALQMRQMIQYPSFQVPAEYSNYFSHMFTTTTCTEDKEDSDIICIDETQYGSLVGTGGKKIDSIRDQSKANITIKAKKDKPPHMYYEVQIKGAKKSVDEAKTLVMNTIYIPPPNDE